MISNKILKTILTLGCGIIIVVFCIYLKNTQNKVRSTLFDLQTKYINTRFQLLDIKEVLHYTIISERSIIPIELDGVLPKNTCILRLHNVSCLGCYAENLIRFCKEMKSKKIPFFVLGTYSSEKELFSELSEIISFDSIPYYNLEKYGILPVDSINRPYLFIRDSNDMVQNMYIFEKGEYVQLKEYINTLSNF